jgi:hypothetical protein
VLLDVNAVPYIPGLFSARTPPKLVSIRLLLRATPAVLPLLTENLLQRLTELYRSYPAEPDVPRPDDLLPSTAAEAKRARVAEVLPGSESTEGGSPLAEREAEGEARRGNSPGPSMELTDALPSVPQGRGLCANEKCKKSSPPGMNMLLCYHTSILLHADVFRLQSTRLSTLARAPRDGNGSSSFGDRIGYHCHGGHRATSWWHPAASNKYHGWDTTGHEGEEGCHEEVFAVSVHLVA